MATVKSAVGVTPAWLVVVWLEVSLVVLLFPVVALTDAVFVKSRELAVVFAAAVAMIVTTALPPAAIVPTVQVTSWPTAEHPADEPAALNVNPAASVSVTTTPVEEAVPVFVTVTV